MLMVITNFIPVEFHVKLSNAKYIIDPTISDIKKTANKLNPAESKDVIKTNITQNLFLDE